MTTNDLFSGNALMDNIKQKMESLKSLLSEIKHSNQNHEFDPSIFNSIYEYINIVQTDCQRITKNKNFHLFSNTNETIQNVFGNTHFSIYFLHLFLIRHKCV